MPSSESITLLLRRWRDGDAQAMDQLVPLVYDELRGLARRELRKDRPGHTLQPTELVHDAYARLVDLELSWQDRVHFYRMAARTMRRVLVDYARARRAEKRGGGAVMVTLDEARGLGDQPASDVLDLADALERLAKVDDRMSQAVEFFYFGGLSYDEIAQALGISRATVDRDLRFARAWLRRELAPADEAGGGDGA
jgi:RNA polymerase sigma factor (TIGR02999 family)